MRDSINDLDTDNGVALDNAVHLETNRAKREIELLAMWASAPRQATALLKRLGFSPLNLTNEDTRSIGLVLFDAGRADDGLAPWSGERIALECQRRLRSVGLWDPNDCRSHVGCMRWGPGPLAKLLTVCDYDASLLAATATSLLGKSTRGRRAAA